MRYVTRFLVITMLWWASYRAVSALDYWLQTDRGFKAGQLQIAAAVERGNI